MELVSIIIPVYNSELFLERCIKSILTQDYKNFELLLIDDGSKDLSGKICDDFSIMDERVVVYHKKNNGVSNARNFGIDQCKGKYVVFVDSDDWVENNYISNLYNFIQNNNLDLACTSFKMIKKNEKKMFKYENELLKEEEKSIKYFDFIHKVSSAPWGKIFKVDVIKDNEIKFEEGIPFAEDFMFLLDYYYCIKSVGLFEETTYNYNCINENQAMKKTYKDMYKYLYKVYEREEKFVEKTSNIILKKELVNEKKRLYNASLEHYISTFTVDIQVIISALKLFGYDYSEENAKICIKQWKLKNAKKYIKYYIKYIFKVFRK